MPHVMNELVLQLDPEPRMEFVSACNNAAWSVGEVALRYGTSTYRIHFISFLDDN